MSSPPLAHVCPAYLGWSVDVACVVANLQGTEHCCQDGGQEYGCEVAL